MVLDWHIVPNTWPVKLRTNLSKHEVLALEGARFQLQRREVFFPCHKFFHDHHTSSPSNGFPCSTKPGCPSNFCRDNCYSKRSNNPQDWPDGCTNLVPPSNDLLIPIIQNCNAKCYARQLSQPLLVLIN